MRTMVGILAVGLCVSQSVIGELKISDFSVDSSSEVTVTATNTTPITRYALKATTDLTGTWESLQYRLARENYQAFQTQIPADAQTMYFRIIQDNFNTGQHSGNWKWFAVHSRTVESLGGYWAKADLSVTNGGLAELDSVQTSLGFSPYGSSDILSVNNTGEIGFTYSPFDIGQVSLDINLSVSFAGAYTPDEDVEMVIDTRVGGSGFTTADLEGTWRFFEITAPDSLDDWAGWMTSELTFTSSGNGTWSSIQRSDGDPSNPGPVAFSVNDDGSILVDPSWPLWQMSLDKNLIVFVLPDPDGGNGLGVMLRAGGTGFKTSDLDGRWKIFTATVPDSPVDWDDWVGWGVSDYDFTAAGVGNAVSTIRSDGSTDPSPTVAFTIADNGMISGGPPGSTWMMSLDKDLIGLVMNDGGGGVTLGLMLRN